MDDSYARFNNCKFKNDKNISVFLTKNCRCEIIGCQFYNLEGKAIFAKESQVYITDTKFINCEKGAATIASKSSLFLNDKIYIQKPNNTAIRAIDNSHVKAIGVVVEDTNGNAVNIDNSDGYFVNCQFKGTLHPTIAIIGRFSNPIFHKCELFDNKETFCVICKNSSRPIFDNCFFANCETNCFSITDFSRPHFQNCTFADIQKYIINAFSGAFVTYENLMNEDGLDLFGKINVSPSAKCEMMPIEKVENSIGNEEEKKVEHTNNQSQKYPTYISPPNICEMNDPIELSQNSLKPLKLFNIEENIEKYDEEPVSIICSKCTCELNENDEPLIISPCGHFVCKDCINDLKRCPICDSPVNKKRKVFFEELCSICLDKAPTTVLLPCGHLCMCYACAYKMAEQNFNCPLCNEPLNGYKYVFKDITIIENDQNEMKFKNQSNSYEGEINSLNDEPINS